MLEILFEDSSCLAVNKPAGLSTQLPPRIDSLERHVREWLGRQAAAGGEHASDIYLGLPHRLDRPVSGVILFAKTRRAARLISRQFERRQVRKIYWACVAGAVDPPEGTWIDFVRKVPDEPRVEIVAAVAPGAQQAVLHYRTLAPATVANKPFTWLEIELETGRMHQIRIQAASRGHPVIGDALYGAATQFGPETADPRERAIALHARTLTIRHPEKNELLTLTAPLPATWQALELAG
ncbi:MAG TPA: RluA family pseudouridine synthase [Pirellulales bacterium]